MVAAVMGTAALVGGVMQANAASNAAGQESDAAKAAMGIQQGAFNTVDQAMSPYMQEGQTALGNAQNLLTNNGYLNGTTAFNPGAAGLPYASSTGAFNFNGNDLANTPGYKFILQQGQNAVNNAQAASGLGVSGAQQKALAGYTTGLADSTYNQQFANQLQAYQQSYGNALNAFDTNYNVAAGQFGRYQGLAQLGQQAGNTLAGAATGVANAQGQAAQGIGQAQAAGTMGVANALGGAFQNAAGAYAYGKMMGGGALPAVDTTGTYNPWASAAIQPSSMQLNPLSG